MTIRRHSYSPVAIFLSLSNNWNLIVQMTKREFIGRYQGSMMGFLWSFFNPFLMLGIYTYVFGVVFKGRWGTSSTNQFEFSMILFAGLIVFNLFTECVTRAPTLIIVNVNFVKKVVFPLEVLPWIILGSALLHAVINTFVLLLVYGFTHYSIHWTVLYLPFLLAPYILFLMGISWLLSSVGVFIRDLGQMIGIFTMVVMFMTPIFYPAEAVPPSFRILVNLNPLAFVVAQARAVVIWGKSPDWLGLMIFTVLSVFVCWVGFFVFQRIRKGFADVL